MIIFLGKSPSSLARALSTTEYTYLSIKVNKVCEREEIAVTSSTSTIVVVKFLTFRMKIVRKSSLDMISELPSNIIENILMLLPLQEAVRTSILSRDWRYEWTKLPQLVFDDTLNPNSLGEPTDIAMKIYEILLLHKGPILKFALDINNLRSCSEIDKIICFLSRSAIQEFTLCMSEEECHKLPSSIFSCLQLRHLFLRFCVFEPPRTFKGFSNLITLELWEVALAPDVYISNCPLLESLKLQSTTGIDSFSIDAPRLKSFWFIGVINNVSVINTPLLALLSLFSEGSVFQLNLIKLLDCLPLIEHLHMDYSILLAVSNVQRKLPTVLTNLRYLELSFIEFTNIDELLCTLCLIRSFPNLQKLRIELFSDPYNDVEQLGMQHYSDVVLDKLREVQVHRFAGLRLELEFIKFLLIKSPVLENMHIVPATSEIDMNSVKMLIEFARYRRASEKAEIIFSLDIDQA